MAGPGQGIAAAARCVDLLDAYRGRALALAEAWLDMELYREVSRDIESIRLACADLPHLAVPWIGVLITHSELIHQLWAGGEVAAKVTNPARRATARALQEHLAAVDALRTACADHAKR